ncbi:MAG: ribonuclease HII [Oscillospiraceae bacterium]|nr:ribonuclease HII [Oscillospiraceae bacterium]
MKNKIDEHERLLSMWQEEEKLYSEGYSAVCGADEAGRGPLAGDVFAAAVVLPRGIEIPGLNDSKKLTEKRREELFDVIREKALCCAITRASVAEIDALNIRNAAFLAMKRAIEQLETDFAIIDGNAFNDCPVPFMTLVKGDSKSASVAAASILAKVSRDRYMLELDEKYPQYGFAKHKGYGTKLHIEALKEYGACEAHRPLFIKKFI